MADFNNDKHLDIALSLKMDRILIFKGNGRGFFALGHDFDPGDTPTKISPADMNRDGNIDLVIANNGIIGKSIAVFHGVGNGSFVKAQSKPTRLVPFIVQTSDFSEDGILDIVVIYGERNTLGLFLGKEDGTFAEPIPFGAEGGPSDMTIGDFNSDGHLDLAVPNNLSHNLSILLGNGDGTFIQPPIDYGTGRVPFSVVSAEFYKGRPPAIVVANNGANSVSVFLPKKPATPKTTSSSEN